MEERHSRTLKLSKVPIRVGSCWKSTAGALLQPEFKNRTFFVCSRQLTVGLYEFEVMVEGEGAHRKGYVNVTVKPGECRKKGHFFTIILIL